MDAGICMKGRIAKSGVHLLSKVDRPQYGVWAQSACGSWAGPVEIMADKVPVSCGACRKLDPTKVETEDISNRPYEPGSGVF
jgi:hypothetical protein